MHIETFGSPIKLGAPLSMQEFELQFEYNHHYLTPYALLKVDSQSFMHENKPFVRFDIDPQSKLGVIKTKIESQVGHSDMFTPVSANLYSPSLHSVSSLFFS